MSPQRSNRDNLIDGALRCMERLPPERVTSRAIAEEAGANVASINYHFGSKENLVAEAVVAGLDRWLEEIAAGLGALRRESATATFQEAAAVLEATRGRHTGLARTLLVALARAQHDPRIRERLAEGYRLSRPNVASTLGLGNDQAGLDAAGLVLALFNGLLIQALLDADLALAGPRLARAQARLRDALPVETDGTSRSAGASGV